MTSPRKAALPHKEALLRSGTKLFYDYGFHGTTVDAVLADAGVPKGSFYHHFGSKDVFGQAVVERYMEFQRNLFGKWSSKKDLSTSDKLVGYAKEMSQMCVKSGYQRGCLAGKLSTEVAPASDVFRRQLGSHIETWTTDLATLLATGQEQGDVRTDRSAREIAEAVLSLIQGTFVLALSTRDKHTLASLVTTLRLLVEPPA
ncbi:TetR/AcrR family transcriptional regulator [Mycobacterium barrassiae]|uniref:TetR/AcrR family transcriptional regulator n=1 Tax=Mycobacterium barrassiae TaxID=319709 RepID=UPI0022658718|nr:TetR/AcrR family transcriptional regulator [Mycobacterium barrassiae]MCV7302968.1 TetR/AcrR family transcriptional regulator [Mycobacterium barrassiae]